MEREEGTGQPEAGLQVPGRAAPTPSACPLRSSALVFQAPCRLFGSGRCWEVWAGDLNKARELAFTLQTLSPAIFLFLCL